MAKNGAIKKLNSLEQRIDDWIERTVEPENWYIGSSGTDICLQCRGYARWMNVADIITEQDVKQAKEHLRANITNWSDSPVSYAYELGEISEEEYNKYLASTKKSKKVEKMAKNKAIKKFTSNLLSRVSEIETYAGSIDETYRYSEENDMDTYSDTESTLYNAVENDITQLLEDMEKLSNYLQDQFMPKSARKSMNKSKYSDIHKRLNKIGGFTKDEEKIEIDDDDVVEIEEEDGQKVVEIEDEEDHAEEVANGEESEDDNLNECNRNVKSKKTVKGMRANKKRMKMRKEDDDYIGDEDDDEDDSARATGKPAPWELEDEEEEEANKRKKSVKRVKMRKAEDMPEDADEQQNQNEKGTGSAGNDMPEDADDNQDENDAGTGNAGSELPEDADEQQNIKESARKTRKSMNRPPVRKFSVTNGGQPNQESFNGRYQQSPMVRNAIDGHFGSKTEKFNEVDMMNERINDLMKSRRNPVSNNGVPKRIH